MDRRVRYEVLHNEDESDDTVTGTETENSERETRPPTMDQTPQASVESTNPTNSAPQASADSRRMVPPQPPSYNIATELPSYEEAERTKAQEAAEMEQQRQTEENERCRVGAFGTIDHFSVIQLGTDGIFICTFVVSLLFNWLGLLASLCITNTVAGRFGAIAGFGLSMVKWVAILKHQNWASGVADTDSWLWWMLIILGFLIFFRGCMQYIRIKYQWNRLGTAIQDRAYLLF